MKYTQVNNKQNKACANNLNDILDQQKQFIDVNKQLQSAVTLTTTSQNPRGKNIRMSNLDTDHRQFSITTEENYWDQ